MLIQKQVFQKFRGSAPWLAIVFAMMLAGSPTAKAQGHIGVVFPLVTRAGGNTTNLADGFGMGIPMGMTIKKSGRTAFDLELVPFIHGTPRNTTLTVHPGMLWDAGHRWTLGMRAAFDINSPSVGFTPLAHYSWPIEHGFFRAYFVEAVLPVRFNRPTGGPNTSPVTFGMHFGLGF
ncbi:MAG: hypothetical protein ABI995_02500 [Acidobacteriota bacterium]